MFQHYDHDNLKAVTLFLGSNTEVFDGVFPDVPVSGRSVDKL